MRRENTIFQRYHNIQSNLIKKDNGAYYVENYTNQCIRIVSSTNSISFAFNDSANKFSKKLIFSLISFAEMINLTDEIILNILKSDEPTNQITLLKWSAEKDQSIGSNFCSDIQRIFVKYERDRIQVDKSYFLKIPHTSALHKYNTKYGIEQREFIIYTKIIPQIQKTNDSVFAPKFYYADENFSLIIEDLTRSNFRLADRIEKLDFQQCQLVFKSLAKLHAYSVKLQKTSKLPEIFHRNTFFLSDDPTYSHLIPVFAKAYDCFLRTFDPTLIQKYSKKLYQFRTNMLKIIASEVKGDDRSFKVLNHGDIWSNNIMFKYDKYGSVEQVRLIDFQLCRWASPAFDILHFATTSMKFQVFENYFDLLLEIYLETLNNTLKYLNCPIYRMEDLKKDIDDKYGFAMLGFTVLTPVIMAYSDDPVDLASILENPLAENSALEKAYRRSSYQDFARQWFLYFVRKRKIT